MKKFVKRHFQLLEVMIALAIVSLCALPLIYPHIFMTREQHTLKRELGYDHVSNLIYADILEQLYKNTIAWDDIEKKAPIPISQEHFTKAKLPGSATVIIHAESKAEGKVCLLTTEIEIKPPAPEKPITYEFKSYLKRAQADNKNPQPEENKKEGKQIEQGEENASAP